METDNTDNLLVRKDELLAKYKRYLKRDLTSQCKVNNDMYVTLVKDLTLEEFIFSLKFYCSLYHKAGCVKCQSALNTSSCLIKHGIVPLATLYREHFKSNYKSDKAIRRVIQLPVVIFRAFGQLFVTEFVHGVNFPKLVGIVSKFVPAKRINGGLNKESLRLLCELASTEKDRRLIRVAASQGQSANAARNSLGISNLTVERERVREAIDEYVEIKNMVNEIAQAKEDVRNSFGLACSDPDDSSSSELSIDSDGDSCDWSNETEGDCTEELSGCSLESQNSVTIPSSEQLLYVLRENNFNWLSFIEETKLRYRQLTEESFDLMLSSFSQLLDSNIVTQDDRELIQQSKNAFHATRPHARARDEVVSDSESDDPEDWVHLRHSTAESKEMLEKIRKQRNIFLKRRKRLIAKEVTRRCLLRRKLPKRVSKTLLKYPHIGADIEAYARENRIGADSWRRTGVLSFTGNVRRGPKITYNRIKAHLEKKYSTKFGYGTIVQLCCAKNKRKLSAQRYFCAAKIVSQRARKGFSIKLNIDAHWSCAFYKALDYLQLKDGTDKTVLNRDDAAGFRLDSTFTHKQHKVLSEVGKPELTTYTDFVNKYTSKLQTTSYMFLRTHTTPEVCVGVVKASLVHEKNPAQHAADLEILEKFEETCFPISKSIECVRVDGATDEGPSHLEVQFMWTERHINHSKLCTLVTTRFAGGSYLNKVELQNGCLALGHSNLFIPSTINGSNFDSNRKLDTTKLKQNLEAAIDVYISAVNGSPCGGKPIHLVKGAQDELAKKYQERRQRLIIFLRGTKKKKMKLKADYPDEYKYFSQVLEVQERHMVPNLPSNYVFMLRLCYQKQCIHPLCAAGRPEKEHLWFKDGPPLSYLPLPIPDPERPWGSPCTTCTGPCVGHYLSPEKNWELVKANNSDEKKPVQPPRQILGEFIKKNNGFSKEDVQRFAKECLLSEEDVDMWLTNIQNMKSHSKKKHKKQKKQVDDGM